jgi:UTP:GlnB (protein PII) uridylyltransferase
MTEFLASMPAAYARAFAAAEVAEHAAIIARRGNRLVHAELCRSGAGRVVCLVADDRPGLLSLITDALLVHAVGVASAQAYVRRRLDGVDEAIDLMDLNQVIDLAELGAFVQTLSELVAEDIRVSSRDVGPPRRSEASRRVYFDLDALRRDEYVLMVQAHDSDGLLHAITSALHAQGVRILACQIGTESGVARDRFEVASLGGEAFSAVELCDIQLAVLDALPRGPSRNPMGE